MYREKGNQVTKDFSSETLEVRGSDKFSNDEAQVLTQNLRPSENILHQ